MKFNVFAEVFMVKAENLLAIELCESEIWDPSIRIPGVLSCRCTPGVWNSSFPESLLFWSLSLVIPAFCCPGDFWAFFLEPRLFPMLLMMTKSFVDSFDVSGCCTLLPSDDPFDVCSRLGDIVLWVMDLVTVPWVSRRLISMSLDVVTLLSSDDPFDVCSRLDDIVLWVVGFMTAPWAPFRALNSRINLMNTFHRTNVLILL